MNKLIQWGFLLIMLSGFVRFAYSAEELDPQVVIREIQKSYEQLNDFKVNIKEQRNNLDVQIKIEGILQFKTPDKIKMDFEIISAQGNYRARNLLVYDGNILWQEQTDLDNKKINVLKSELVNNSIQAQEILGQFSPKLQFANFIRQYNVIGLRLLNGEDASVYILDLEIKPDARDSMIQMLKAKGEQKPEAMVPEKVVFYWDHIKEFVLKIETQSKGQEFKTLVEYADPEVNSGLEDGVFAYTPATDIAVIDMSNIVSKEAGFREFEGAENKLVGQVFPDFNLDDIFNDNYSYDDLKGKILIVHFWEQGNASCRKELPRIENLYQDVYTDAIVKIITITTDSEKALELVEEESYSFPVLIDSKAELAEQLKIFSVPKTFVVNQQGLITAVYMGNHSDIQEILKKEINRLTPEE